MSRHGAEWAVPGGRLVLEGLSLTLSAERPPVATVGGVPAHVLSASATRLHITIPLETPAGTVDVRVEPEGAQVGSVIVGRQLADGLHQVDSPAFDGLGRLFVTQSGSRDTQAQVPLYRIGHDGKREPVAVDLPNPTSLAMGPDGAMYVSSRFEGQVYRLFADDRVEVYASDLGVPTGLAFSADGSLFVGDRSGSIFRVRPNREVELFATLPLSVAAFHLAFGPDECLYVSAPTLASHDPIYRITPDRLVDVLVDGFGRPQGLAFDSTGDLYVVDSLAGASSLYRLNPQRPEPHLVLAAPMLIGLAIDPQGGLIVSSNDTIWKLDVPLKPWPSAFRVG
ncbi:MAG: gluconolaconase [Vicinamibacterales bacterium]